MVLAACEDAGTFEIADDSGGKLLQDGARLLQSSEEGGTDHVSGGGADDGAGHDTGVEVGPADSVVPTRDEAGALDVGADDASDVATGEDAAELSCHWLDSGGGADHGVCEVACEDAGGVEAEGSIDEAGADEGGEVALEVPGLGCGEPPSPGQTA